VKHINFCCISIESTRFFTLKVSNVSYYNQVNIFYLPRMSLHSLQNFIFLLQIEYIKLSFTTSHKCNIWIYQTIIYIAIKQLFCNSSKNTPIFLKKYIFLIKKTKIKNQNSTQILSILIEPYSMYFIFNLI
jgi:hypothetical protein